MISVRIRSFRLESTRCDVFKGKTKMETRDVIDGDAKEYWRRQGRVR